MSENPEYTRWLLVGLLVAITGVGVAGAVLWGPRVDLSNLYMIHQSVVAGVVIGIAVRLLPWAETVLGRVTLLHVTGSALVAVVIGGALGLGAGIGIGFPLYGAGALLVGGVVGAAGMSYAGETYTPGGFIVVTLGATYCYAFVLVIGTLGPYPSNLAAIGLAYTTLWLGVIVRAGTQEVSAAT